MLYKKAPNCPVHVSIRMKLADSMQPAFFFIQTNRRHKARMKEPDMRKIYRCPVPGCPRVEAEDLKMV